MRDRQTARVTSGVGLLHQLEIADDVLIVERVAVKFFQQIESDVRLAFQNCIADDAEVVIDADRRDFVPHLLQRRDHVPFSFERRDLFRRQTFD